MVASVSVVRSAMEVGSAPTNVMHSQGQSGASDGGLFVIATAIYVSILWYPSLDYPMGTKEDEKAPYRST